MEQEKLLERDFDKMKKEKDNTKKCPICGKYLEYENIGYLRYGFVCNNIHCTNDANRS